LQSTLLAHFNRFHGILVAKHTNSYIGYQYLTSEWTGVSILFHICTEARVRVSFMMWNFWANLVWPMTWDIGKKWGKKRLEIWIDRPRSPLLKSMSETVLQASFKPADGERCNFIWAKGDLRSIAGQFPRKPVSHKGTKIFVMIKCTFVHLKWISLARMI